MEKNTKKASLSNISIYTITTHSRTLSQTQITKSFSFDRLETMPFPFPPSPPPPFLFSFIPTTISHACLAVLISDHHLFSCNSYRYTSFSFSLKRKYPFLFLQIPLYMTRNWKRNQPVVKFWSELYTFYLLSFDKNSISGSH